MRAPPATCDDAGEMSETPTIPEAYPRLVRPQRGRLVAGVAQGAAAQLKLDPVVLRLAFVLLTILDGLGLLAYAALWMFTPQEQSEGEPPSRDWGQIAAYAVLGTALTAFGWVTGASTGGIGTWSIALGGIGTLI